VSGPEEMLGTVIEMRKGPIYVPSVTGQWSSARFAETTDREILSRGSTSSHVIQPPLQESADASARRDIPIVQSTTMVAT